MNATPLIDMGSATYLGYPGGLYPDGVNSPPPAHAAAGVLFSREIRPLDMNGDPDENGKYLLLSVGMSNTTQEFCGSSHDGVTCKPWTFMGQAASDPQVERTDLAIVNGAMASQDAENWESPDAENYDRIRDEIFLPLGLSEAQVQVVWLKVANSEPTVSLPAEEADALDLFERTGNIVRALRIRYPNLRLVLLSSRIYAGYATSTLNPEPYAYESGFAVKWLIEAQIDQMSGGGIDPVAGDLNYETIAPWLGWGPYLWADGMSPRSDGLIWEPGDFQEDGTHPSTNGETKVGTLLLDFFSTSSVTSCWFLADLDCSPIAIFLPTLFSSATGSFSTEALVRSR